jgi:hypothetical protein
MKADSQTLHSHAKQPTLGQFIARILSGPIGPSPVMGGMSADGNLPEEDFGLLAKTSHVREPNEPLASLVARTSISPDQLRSWSKDEIARRVALAEANRDNDPAMPLPTIFDPEQNRRRPAVRQSILVG